jgi:hypothetical protein
MMTVLKPLQDKAQTGAGKNFCYKSGAGLVSHPRRRSISPERQRLSVARNLQRLASFGWELAIIRVAAAVVSLRVNRVACVSAYKRSKSKFFSPVTLVTTNG